MSKPTLESTKHVFERDETRQKRVLVVIVCYRAVDLTIDCLCSLESEHDQVTGLRVAVCENGTGGDSAQKLAEAIDAHGWSEWVSLKTIHPNRGFTGGNNVILRSALSQPDPPEFFLLLNADTVVRSGAVRLLLEAAGRHPEAGILSPRLEWPDGTPQVSCFLDRSPMHEFYQAARTLLIDRIFHVRNEHPLVSDVPCEVEWTSFACALIRREVCRDIGLLDEGYFLYFDDPDYCRRARAAGWTVYHQPQARVVHLRGRSNPLKSLTAERKRRPGYWYESRARYYAKNYGRRGLWAANVCWWLGRSISLARELLGTKRPHTCEREWLDIWTNGWDPVREPPRYPPA